MTTYTISDLAKEFGLTLRTLRFWETRGLLKPARSGMTRAYSESDRAEIAQIVTWRAQRFTVEEIKIALQGGGFSHDQLLAQLKYLHLERAEIDQAIADLDQRTSLGAPIKVATV
jgi:DNA-binding transcriptional MerR regulator